MQNRKPTGAVADAVREILTPMGYAVVEFSAEHVKGRTHVHCVLHHPNGINLDSLGEVHSTLQPRLEVLLDDEDLYIEFSSPGIDRVFKSFHEFQVFLGKRATVLLGDKNEWIEGTILEADDTRCRFADDTGTEHTLAPEGVVKARLAD